MKKKQTIIAALIAAIVLLAVGCGNKAIESSENLPGNTEVPVQTEASTTEPGQTPDAEPTAEASAAPMQSSEPTQAPEGSVGQTATVVPTAEATQASGPAATAAPTATPAETTGSPAQTTDAPAVTTAPTVAATTAPTAAATQAPGAAATATPTVKPTATPTVKPTATPTTAPTAVPTSAATATPTTKPTAAPTATPTAVPTATPTPAPHVHSYVTKTEAATCTAEGRSYDECSTCGAITNETVIPMVDHEYKKIYPLGDEPTCKNGAYYTLWCIYCDAYGGGGSDDPLPCTPVGTVVFEATCVPDSGVMEFHCAVCGCNLGRETYTDPNAEHSWKEYTGQRWNEELLTVETYTVIQCEECHITKE